MKRTTKATAIGLLAAVTMLASATSAQAADEPRFPVIPGAPTWYAAASNAPYASSDTTSADQLSVQEEAEWYAGAWWYGPDGGAPESAEPDIIVETFLRGDWEVGATDPNLITLSLNAAFPALTDSLGTEFTNGFAIPNGKSGATPTLIFPGDGIILAQRPARDCLVTNDLKDPARFTVNLAMLGANQSKYLVNLTVEYGARTWNDACANAVPVTPAEEDTAPKLEQAEKVDEIKKATGTTTASDGEASPRETAQGWQEPVLLIGVIALVGVVVLILFLFKRPKKTHQNDGRSIQDSLASRSDENPNPSPKRSEFGRW